LSLNFFGSVHLLLPPPVRLGDVVVFKYRQPLIEAKFINKSSLFILLLGVIRLPKMKVINEQNAENTFVAPPYCQTAMLY